MTLVTITPGPVLSVYDNGKLIVQGQAIHARGAALAERAGRGNRAMIAALYVETNGRYFNLDGVDPWDQGRDARLYAGPWPVVAHPPCQRWGKLWAGQPLWIKRTGERKVKGDDAGCFEAALASVRKWGGVLEHPWGSHAWPHFNINTPPRHGGWIKADEWGWTCCVEQGRYGHYARKPTLLYAVGVDLPELRWGVSQAQFPPEAIAKHGLAYCKRAGELAFKGGGKDSSARIGTPPEFRRILIDMAKSVPAVHFPLVLRKRRVKRGYEQGRDWNDRTNSSRHRHQNP